MTPHDTFRGSLHREQLTMYAKEVRIEFDWNRNLQSKHVIHPLVVNVIRLGYDLAPGYTIKTIAREWPHRSTSDPIRIAYTRTVEHGIEGRTTVTSVAKYIKQRFPGVLDHELRDDTALLQSDGCSLVKDANGMIDAVQKGPRSCMRWHRDTIALVGHHPYTVYAPEHGWAMAVRIDGGMIDGRALVLHKDDKPHCFVRSYMRPEQEQNASPTDTVLEAWLREKGFAKLAGWPFGTKLRRVTNSRGGLVLPYIDGCNRLIDSFNADTFVFDVQGQYLCESTTGSFSIDRGARCPRCRSRGHSSIVLYDGTSGGTPGCTSCISLELRRARFLGRDQYAPIPALIAVDGVWHINTEENLAYYKVVVTQDGRRTTQRNCRQFDGQWYHLDDLYVIDDMYYRREDTVDTVDWGPYPKVRTWVCAVSGLRYSENTHHVKVGNKTFHRDQGLAIAEAMSALTEERQLRAAIVTTHSPAEPAFVPTTVREPQEETIDDIPF